MQWLISAMLLLASTPAVLAQESSADAAYCPDLKEVAARAVLGAGFSAIGGKPRDGSFRDTTLPLRGWKDCTLYGQGIYTCDSPDLDSAEEAEKAQATIARQIVACLANTWAEVKDRSAAGYVVLHPAKGAASITLSIDQTDQQRYLVRFTLFLRRG